MATNSTAPDSPLKNPVPTAPRILTAFHKPVKKPIICLAFLAIIFDRFVIVLEMDLKILSESNPPLKFKAFEKAVVMVLNPLEATRPI
ncbi:hypothetical protein [Pediococcus pentosaceus]|uniref:hypothetical protein n=1 Tax=Pediococcus pentosaceus TaxID=1255 RepID=UPI000CFE672E|nr:hypothetical protein [Pediococcus pentosaceus]AVL01277.1 hypothetical protein PP40703_00010 [Pediococcus pentosaceus]